MNAVYAGAGIAAAAGLLMGAAMKPDLGLDDRPAGPQIVAGTDRGRASGPFDDGLTYAAGRGGKIPDYVYGTDWKRAAAAPLDADVSQPAAEPERSRGPDEDAAPVQLTRADYDEPKRPRVIYPSIDGGAPAGMDLLPPPDADDGGAG